MRRVALAFVASVSLNALAAKAEIESVGPPVGEIIIDFKVIPFFLPDIERVDRLEIGGTQAVNVILAVRLDEHLSASTRGKVGSKIKLRLCGKTLLTATIEEELLEASFLIVVPKEGRADAIATDLLNPPCANSIS
jgi:hypothetical protein